MSKNSIDFKAHHYAQELVTRFQASAFGQRDIVVRRMWGTGKHADTESFRYTVHLRQPLSAHSKYAFVFTTDWTTTTDGAVSALTGVECGEGALLNSTDDVRLYTHLVLRQVGKDWAFEGIYRSPGHPNAAIIGAAAKPGPHVATLDRSKPRHVISQMAMMIYDATRGELGHFGPAFTQPAGTTHPSIIKQIEAGTALGLLAMYLEAQVEGHYILFMGAREARLALWEDRTRAWLSGEARRDASRIGWWSS